MTCQNSHKVSMTIPVTVGPCADKATKVRKTWRWGDKAKGEPSIVNTVVHLCAECTKDWDEAKQEAEWEAKVS